MKKILIILMFILPTVVYAQTTHITLTCYRPIKKECNSQPLITADNSKINLKHLKKGHIKWCAISRDLLWLFPKNKPKRIYIEGYGTYEVKDLMNKRYNHAVDILIHPKDKKRIKVKNVKIKIIR